MATDNPYQPFTIPAPKPVSTGGVGDFLRNIFSVSSGVNPANVPVNPANVPVNPANVPVNPANVPVNPANVPVNPAAQIAQAKPKEPYRTPYQPFTIPAPKPVSIGGVGDFLRNIFSVSSGVNPANVPVNPAAQIAQVKPKEPYRTPYEPTTAGTWERPIITPTGEYQLPNNNSALDSIISGQPRTIVAQPKLAQAVQRTGLPAYDDQSVLVRAPKGYTAPTPEGIAKANAVSDAYWAPYRRAAQMQERGLAIKELEARNKYAPKPPTLRDLLYGQAAEAAKGLYEVDVAGIDPKLSTEEQSKLRAAARKAYLQNIIDIAQPKAAEAGLYRGE